jgi:hypothetical protein
VARSGSTYTAEIRFLEGLCGLGSNWFRYTINGICVDGAVVFEDLEPSRDLLMHVDLPGYPVKIDRRFQSRGCGPTSRVIIVRAAQRIFRSPNDRQLPPKLNLFQPKNIINSLKWLNRPLRQHPRYLFQRPPRPAGSCSRSHRKLQLHRITR